MKAQQSTEEEAEDEKGKNVTPVAPSAYKIEASFMKDGYFRMQSFSFSIALSHTSPALTI